MDIGSAIRILCEVHTRTRDDMGFEVIMGAVPDHYTGLGEHYVEAWEALRRAVDLPIEPEVQDEGRLRRARHGQDQDHREDSPRGHMWKTFSLTD